MIALIMKDFASTRQSILLAGGLGVAISVYAITQDFPLMIFLVSLMLPLILNGIAVGYDSKADFESFAFSMPIKRSHYVLSKYAFALLFGVVGAVTLFAVLVLRSHLPIRTALVPAIATLVVPVLFTAIQLPFMLKYGAERGRVFMVVTYFLIFGGTSLFKAYVTPDVIARGMRFLSGPWAPWAILAVGVVLIYFLFRLAVRVAENKEY